MPAYGRKLHVDYHLQRTALRSITTAVEILYRHEAEYGNADGQHADHNRKFAAGGYL
jgi:hypothetical protein